MMMGGAAPRRAAAHLLSPLEQVDRGGWAAHLLTAHKAAVDLHETFTHDKLQMAFFAPRRLAITIPDDPRSAAKDFPPTMDTDVLPPGLLSPGSARGVIHIAAGIRRLSEWRRFLDILGAAPDHTRAKLLTHYGHDNVSVLLTNTPHAKNASPKVARVTIRRITGAPALGHHQCEASDACPVCDTRGNAPGSLEQHAARCPARGARAFMHAGLISTLQKVLKEAGVPTSSTPTEARGLRGRADKI